MDFENWLKTLADEGGCRWRRRTIAWKRLISSTVELNQ